MKTTCPLNGESECDGCKFYTKDFTTDWTCTFTAILLHLNENNQNMKNAANSVEQSREITVQTLRSKVAGEPTDELQRLIGLDDIPRKNLPPR